METTTSEATPEIKRKLKETRKVKRPQVDAWLQAVKAAQPSFDDVSTKINRDAVSSLHDVKAIVTTLLHTAERIVWRQPGESMDDKVSKCDPEIRTIYQSCRLLESLFKYTDLIANPESARFGSPSPRSIYKVIDLMVKVFESRAALRSVSIELRGPSFNRPRVYESLFVAPFVLLDNAVKYAQRNSVVQVEVSDRTMDSVFIEVASRGELIPRDEQAVVFDKGIRGSNSFGLGPGSGLGLFVGQHVARTNGSAIIYQGVPDKPGSTFGMNKFFMLISSVK